MWPMRVYVSGPMTGYKDHNKAAFEAAAEELRAMGHTPTTPVELDHADNVAIDGDGWNVPDEEYEQLLARDVAPLTSDNYDAVVFIEGWQWSGGAGREGRKAIREGLRLYVLRDGLLLSLSPKQFLHNSRTERLRPEEVEHVRT